MPEPAPKQVASTVTSLAGRASLDSAAFVAGLRAGEPTAFERLFQELYLPLCDFAATYVSYDVAEDLVQDVVLRLWNGRSRIELDKSIRGYLYRSTYNAVVNYQRHRGIELRWRKREEGVIQASASTWTAAPAELSLAEAEIEAAVEYALQTLPERCRMVYMLRWQHQLSYIEIANVMEISPKTVEHQMGKALKVMRKALLPFVDRG